MMNRFDQPYINRHMLPILAISGLLFTTLLSGCTGSALHEMSNDDDFVPTNYEPPIHLNDGSLGSGQSQKFGLGEREYILAMPQNYDAAKAYKLLLAFHGSGSMASAMQGVSRFERLSDQYIVAYPQAAFEAEEWNEGCGCNKPNRLGIDDLAYVDEVIADISAHYAINEQEIYGVGFSQGALFAQNLLCNRSETFKAIASVASAMSVQLSQSCQISTPTSYMLVHGKQDRVLPFAGLEHSNFGLIASPAAINLVAELNQSLADPIVKHEDGVELTAYWNGQQKTHLYAIDNGDHRWNFESFDTSNEILDFFATAHEPELPQYSQLVEVDGNKLHVRTMGQDNEKPTIVLLSGPNKNFHADSAWFASVQPMLAQQYKVHAVDRSGNGWSEFDAQTSYLHFATQLHQVLLELEVQKVILVSFASGNITSRWFHDKYQHDSQVQVEGMLWIDPDIFLPHSIAMYQDYPVSYYRENLGALLPHLQTGAWNERTFNKLVAEREEVSALVANKPMDWAYFDAMIQQRLLIDRQQTRAIEIAHYHDDLNGVKALPLIDSVAVSVIDSDFETAQIAQYPDAAASLTQWMEEGTQWSQQVADASGGQYIPLINASHLVTFEHPQVIVDAVNWLTQP